MKRWIVALLFAAIITILHLVVLNSFLGERIEPLMLDLWSRVKGSRPVPSEVVVVAMDEGSYASLAVPFNQAWPRRLHAKLIERLAAMGAKRAAFDILFLDQGADSKADEAMTRALKKLPVVLGADSIIREQSSASGTISFAELQMPYEPFAKTSTLGLVGLPEDNGYVRRFLVKRDAASKGVATLSEAAVDIPSTSPRPNERDLINYYGPADSVNVFSYAQILDDLNPLPPGLFKDKIVLVGLALKTDVGPAQKDKFLTPYDRIYGVEIHATAALNLLHRDWIRRASRAFESIALGLLSLSICTGLFLLRPISGGVLVVGTTLAWLAGSYFGLGRYYFIPGLTFFAAFLPLAYLGSTLYYYFVTRRAQLKIESAFTLYVSPEMAHQIAANHGSLKLGGEKVWATALFTDIAGFTSITEELPAEKVSAMLNAYFTEVMEVVFQNQGTLLKFIGDAVFVLWGAPIRINDHATKACQTALAIAREVERFNRSGRFPALHTRIGVNTGPMVAGNLGSERRFDYTAIGDSVNLASRVEGINKYFGTDVLITETTKKEIGDAFHTLSVGSIKVAGKREAVELYALLREPLPAEITSEWSKGIAAYRARRWSDAIAAFESLKDRAPQLQDAVQLYREQIDGFRQAPPAEDWMGEVTFSVK